VAGLTVRRFTDLSFYTGVVLLLAAVAWTFGARYRWSFLSARWDWAWYVLVIGGVALTVLSFVVAGLRRDGRRVSRRSVKYGANTAAIAVLLLGIVGLVEAFSYRHSARLDLTENRRYSLSP